MYGGYSRRIEKSDRWTLEEPDEIQAVLIVLEVLAFGRRALRRRNGSLHTPRNHRFIENGALPSLTELTVEILLNRVGFLNANVPLRQSTRSFTISDYNQGYPEYRPRLGQHGRRTVVNLPPRVG